MMVIEQKIELGSQCSVQNEMKGGARLERYKDTFIRWQHFFLFTYLTS